MSEFNILDITLDEKVTWSSHTIKIAKTISQGRNSKKNKEILSHEDFQNDIQLFVIAKIILRIAFMEVQQQQYIQDTGESSKIISNSKYNAVLI